MIIELKNINAKSNLFKRKLVENNELYRSIFHYKR